MRALISTAAVVVLAFAMVATQANATPGATFGAGAKLPAGCTADGSGNLSCTTTGSPTLNFSVIIHIGALGLSNFSMGIQWDSGLENALTINSATQGPRTYVYVSAGPPPLTVGYAPLGGTNAPIGPGGLTQSTVSSAGLGTNFEAPAASPDSNVQLLSANSSFRAGRLSVTVDDSNTGTRIQLGHFHPVQDSYNGAGGSTVPGVYWGYIDFNGGPGAVPEPGTTLLMGLGMLGLVLAGRSSRK